MASQSEPASSRKLQRARALGDIPHSPHLAQGLVLCALASIATVWTKGFAGHARDSLTWALQNHSADSETLRTQIGVALEFLVAYTVPVLALAMITQIAVRVIEARFPGSASFGASRPKRPSAFRLRELVSADAAWTTFASWGIVVVLVGCAWVWYTRHASLLLATLGNPWAGQRVLHAAALKLMRFACGLWMIVGVLGLTVSHWLWQRRNRMSREEQLSEAKETRGDPSIVLARQHLRQQLLNEWSSAGPRDATILVVDPEREAALLHYDATVEPTPRLLGIARAGKFRETVLEAQHHGVPIFERPDLAAALARGTVGETIAESNYRAVAELLSSVMVNESDRS